MKILIVDDEIEFASTLCQRLKLRKYEVIEAYSGAEGLSAITTSPPDIALLDLKMPDMDGLELLAIIRKQLPQTKVIMLTGHGSGEAGEQALTMGASAYLMKPVDFKELLVTVEETAKG